MSDGIEKQLALARRQLEATQEISAALYAVTDIEALQSLAMRTAMDAVDADAGSLLLYDADQNTLVFRHVVGPVADTLQGTALDLSLGLGIAGQVFTTGEARVTHDVGQDTDHVGTVDARTGYQTHSLMTVPLRRRDGPPVGVVQFVNKRSGIFDANDIAVIEVIGSLVVMAVENAILAERGKLAAVARSIGEISHDIGNMLTGVLPYVQSLKGCIEDVRAGKPNALEGLEGFYEEVVENVRDGVEQVEARTKEIARAVKGEVAPMEFEPGHPYRAALRVFQSLKAVAEQQGVEIDIEGDPELRAVYDRNRIYNALYNLVNNAVAETPAQGHVTVSVTAAPSDDRSYCLTVRDTGGGMPEDVRRTLFTDAARSTKPGGTGLGTRIVQRIVEQHGGKVSVVSRLGEGTTITLTLPCEPPVLEDLVSLSTRNG
jgi:signal transduction histidine kinase